MNLVEAGIAELRAALVAGQTTSVALVAGYLDRIARYDRQGIALNAVPVLNPAMFEEARAADLRRAAGQPEARLPRTWAADVFSGVAIAAPVYWIFTKFLAINLPGLTSTGWI